MISESELWKTEINKISKKLLSRIFQKKWSKRSIFNLEKELFIGFFSVRKLIESNHISKELADKEYELLFFPKKSLTVEEANKILPYNAKGAIKRRV